MNYDSEGGRGKRIVEFDFNNIFNNSRGEGSLFSLVPVSNSRRINPMDSTGLIMTRVNCIENSNARWLIIVGREIKWKKVRYKFARFVSGLI